MEVIISTKQDLNKACDQALKRYRYYCSPAWSVRAMMVEFLVNWEGRPAWGDDWSPFLRQVNWPQLIDDADIEAQEGLDNEIPHYAAFIHE